MLEFIASVYNQMGLVTFVFVASFAFVLAVFQALIIYLIVDKAIEITRGY